MKIKLNQQAVDKNDKLSLVSYKAKIGSTAFRFDTRGVKDDFRPSWIDCRDAHLTSNFLACHALTV